ncbi:hypothetical protein HOE49_04150 [Candidatus Peregrinibacteria bacterium]|jgi:hypothetical protein|nr:hypothetical protein [Candidatus Peregrinibacteria bacterium]
MKKILSIVFVAAFLLTACVSVDEIATGDKVDEEEVIVEEVVVDEEEVVVDEDEVVVDEDEVVEPVVEPIVEDEVEVPATEEVVVEEVVVTSVNCGGNMDCFIDRVSQGLPAEVDYTFTANVFGIVLVSEESMSFGKSFGETYFFNSKLRNLYTMLDIELAEVLSGDMSKEQKLSMVGDYYGFSADYFSKEDVAGFIDIFDGLTFAQIQMGARDFFADKFPYGKGAVERCSVIDLNDLADTLNKARNGIYSLEDLNSDRCTLFTS